MQSNVHRVSDILCKASHISQSMVLCTQIHVYMYTECVGVMDIIHGGITLQNQQTPKIILKFIEKAKK